MFASFVLIIHDVEGYAVWRKIFDEAAPLRKAAGEISFQLLRTQVDANRIVHFSCWQSLGEAQRFFESAELVAIRRRAGVKAPEFIYLTELDRGTL
jgi:heme-degrading monooxygenase HmoA